MDIALIPAKSYSRRLSNKNIKKIYGKPIISYAISKAKQSKCFEKIFVSTESQKVRSISLKYGADNYELRNKKYCKNETTLTDLMSYEAKRIKKKFPYVKNICCILPTALFFDVKQIKNSKAILKKKRNLKFSFICSEIDHGLSKTFYLIKNKVKISNNIFLKKNSQFFPKFYIDTGQFYYGRSGCWIKKEDIFDNTCNLITIPFEKFVDINNIKDWKKAKKLFKKR
tara:strand:- start:2225 stop:2905 length:681 start_codon:yes stop_codon:yes gene_type:complete